MEILSHSIEEYHRALRTELGRTLRARYETNVDSSPFDSLLQQLDRAAENAAEAGPRPAR
jgi:hypothetical protein